ncbi:hypothetical protein QTP70_003896 [Hemibagrus guttatus]|uniref:Reverse transcriptase n=1 Tax=Hemibagrus guttatus TaxID=175788 RepID=A0AAE0QF33_9TELE|nr:hypothetical protein QTP70_003896 [Hemibagrus guttatus]
MWQGIQAITNYKTTPSAYDSDASLPDAPNDFYARFEAQNSVATRKTIPPPNDQVLCLSTADVKRTVCRVIPQKSAGSDNIPGRVLRECGEQLADVFTDIFNIFLSSAVVPTCLKTMTIVPVPKKSTVSCLNDYRPVALTPIAMKCFERLIMRHIKTQLPHSLIIGVSLPSITDMYTTRCIRKANSVVDDPTHPSHTLFTLLSSGKKYQSIRALKNRLCNSFFPQAIRLLNTQN